jgi:hypothetical protein
MLFLKQPAWLWVKKNDPTKLPPVDENTQALFDSGHKFEQYGEALFPEGLTLGFTDYSEYVSLPKRTQDAISSGAQVLFQPRFEWENYTCICDIVSFIEDNVVDLYEIKASTKVKPEHVFDLAFQTAVLEGCGLSVRNIYVIHANNQYVRDGEIVAEQITGTEDITESVRAKAESTNKYMPLAYSVARSQTMPDPSPNHAKLGSKNDWLRIYENIVPSEKNVWPDGTEPIVDKNKLNGFLDQLEYPIYFLDYETLMSVVPYFDGHRPYQQVPFQYSVHVMKEPDAEIEWYEYLHRDNSNPIRPLTEQLLKDIGTSGTVLVWYEKFEKSRNSELGLMLPEYKEALEYVNGRIIDLIIPFKNKWYDDPRCEGSASIKAVLPVLCPELSYKELGIQEGGSAQRLWMEAVLDEKRADQKEQILSDLIEYCKLDTLAMVEIFKCLKSKCS